MTAISIQDELQQRYEKSLATLQKAGLDGMDIDHPVWRAHQAEVHALMRHGFELPSPGLYIVAAFATKPSNPLQALGRSIYYRNPSRYHALLPLLGEQMPKRPGESGPGWWKAPQATR